MIRRRMLAPVAMPTAEGLLAGLNPEQSEAVRHYTGPMLVGAGAGAGKTKVLTTRTAYLEVMYGVPGDRILVMTFSKKAAGEMNERLQRLLPKAQARMGTFHSIAIQFLKEEYPERMIGEGVQGSWRVDETGKYRSCVKEILGFKGMKWQG